MSPFDNNFFEEDPFENIIKEFFGGGPFENDKKRNMIIKGEEEDRNIDFLEDENYVYLIFEFPGYNEKDISLSIKGNQLEIKARKNEEAYEKVQPYLNEKLYQGIFIKKTLPRFIIPKKFKHTINNGVLEIIFNKK